MTLTEFLAARLDEKEAAASDFHDSATCGSLDRDGGFEPDRCDCGYPARVLREVAAKRAILARHAPEPDWPVGRCRSCITVREGYPEEWPIDPYPCATLGDLAAIDSDHPDYDPAWAPGA